MKHDRPGDWLWYEWDGDGYTSFYLSSIVYVTFGEVEPGSDMAQRALASALQRDGVADSLGDGFKRIGMAIVTQGHSGPVGGEGWTTKCNDQGVTELGDLVDRKVVTTWAEFSV